jgi:hypothetical protein
MKKILLLKLLLIGLLFSNELKLNNNSIGLNINTSSPHKEKIKCLMSLKDYNEIYKCEEIVKSNIKKDNINQKEIKNQQATHYNNENKNDEEYIDKKELIKKCIKEATTKEELEKCKYIK